MHKEFVEIVVDVQDSKQAAGNSPSSTCFSQYNSPPSTSSDSSNSSALSTPSTSPTPHDAQQQQHPSSTTSTTTTTTCSSQDDPKSFAVELVVIPNQPDAPGMFKPCVPDEQILARCASTLSTDSFADCCRICQQHGEEPLLELGCRCRGELAKAHLSCIEQWFGNKGSNKCEICQHVAENVPAPPAQPAPHFWVWRLGINRGSRSYAPRNTESGRARFHPLWAALLILIAGLLFDVLISIFLGASALPVNIIIGVLVVLGIGTAARLVVECWHERGLRRNIRRIENNLAHLQEEVHHGSMLQTQPTSFILHSAAVRPLP